MGQPAQQPAELGIPRPQERQSHHLHLRQNHKPWWSLADFGSDVAPTGSLLRSAELWALGDQFSCITSPPAPTSAHHPLLRTQCYGEGAALSQEHPEGAFVPLPRAQARVLPTTGTLAGSGCIGDRVDFCKQSSQGRLVSEQRLGWADGLSKRFPSFILARVKLHE